MPSHDHDTAHACSCCSSGLAAAYEAASRAGLSRRNLLLGAGTAALGNWAVTAATVGAESARPAALPAFAPAAELLVQPVLTYALQRQVGVAPGSFWEAYGGPERRLDTGPLWFVGVLLVFSLGYAGWRDIRSRRSSSHEPHGARRDITVGTLALAALIVAPASFAVRLVYPYGSESGVSDLNFWEWPACIAVFALGVAASRRGCARSGPVTARGHARRRRAARRDSAPRAQAAPPPRRGVRRRNCAHPVA